MNIPGTRTVWLAFTLLAAEALFAVPKLSWELAAGEASRASTILGFAGACFAILVTWFARGWLACRFRALATSLARIPTPRWILLCILVGVVLRFLWVFFFPAPQRSDQATYLLLAKSLVERGQYQSTGTGIAYWPPGYPFFLYAFFKVFGIRPWVPMVANLLLFGGTIGVAHRLASWVGGLGVARLATLFLVFWPTYVTSGGLASKEMFVLFLLPSATLVYFTAVELGKQWSGLLLAFLTGAILGFAGLTQPSLLLFPSVLLLYEWLRREGLGGPALRFVCVLIGMSLMISPWTLRNYRVLHQWVPVSTNGGDVFYSANNPLATGGYTLRSEHSLEQLDEVQRGKVGYQLGTEWIRANPGAFLLLAVRKQILFLGDDGQGVYETLKRGLGITDARYLFLKALCNVFWWGIWVLVFTMLSYRRKDRFLNSPEVCALMLAFAYLYAIHSLFQSGAKYHVPLTVFLAIVAALLAWEDPGEAITSETKPRRETRPNRGGYENHTCRRRQAPCPAPSNGSYISAV